jgi:hypothetical protein
VEDVYGLQRREFRRCNPFPLKKVFHV